MVTIIHENEISEIVKDIDLVGAMREGFVQYSDGNAVVPPVGELLFEEPPGETHLKYGYIKGKEFYTIKIASGFPDNADLGISSSQGMMILFSQKTGETKAVLLDNGKLTDLRTAAAGALVARYFGPSKITALGVLGTGIQARLQLELLLNQTNCKTVWIWGRSKEKAALLKELYSKDITVWIAETPSEVAENCNLIVTTTSAEVPLLEESDIKEGTHITAVGSDTRHKRELGPAVLQKADIVISDSISQAAARGEIFQAVQEGSITMDSVVELGKALQSKDLQRANDQQITIADLTGVAVQDIMIAEAVYSNYITRKKSP